MSDYQRLLDELPEDWQLKPIAELGTIVSGGTPSRDVPAFWGGDIPWVTPGEVSKRDTKIISESIESITQRGLSSSGANLLPAGSLLVTSRATLGAKVVCSVPVSTNQGFKSIVFHQRSDSDFYYHFFDKVIGEIERRASGTTFLEISGKEFAEIELPCPSDGEKKIIADILDTINTQIQKSEAIIAKLQQVKQGLLHDLLTRGVDANGQLRPLREQAPELYKESPLGWIPVEWEVSTVGDQFQIQLGKMLDAEKNSGVFKPYLGNKAVQWDFIDLSEVHEMQMSASDMSRFRLQQGDLLVCEGGEVGRAAVWESPITECYYQKALHRLRPTKGFEPRLMLEILRYFLSCDALSEYVSRTSIAHLTKEKFSQVPLPTPPKREQIRLVERFMAHKSRYQQEQSELDKLSKLKSGLMDDLLTGRVRVKHLTS